MGRGRPGPWMNQPSEGCGTGFLQVGWILTPAHGLINLLQGPQICSSDFAGSGLSRSIGEAATQQLIPLIFTAAWPNLTLDTVQANWPPNTSGS